jgi:hypothetical protein
VTKRMNLLSVGILLVLLANVGYGQEYRGRVQGLVTDTSKAVLANATVELLNVNTGVAATRHTGSDGLYLFDLVEPGTYKVTVDMVGFGKFILENVLVKSRGDVTLNAELQVGNAQREVVEVQATASSVEFNTSKLELDVNQKMADVLPQVHRNPFLLAQLDPSVELPNDGQSEVEPYNSWGGNHLRVGGGLIYTNSEDVDGAAVGIGTKVSFIPSPDSIQEVVVQQNQVDAEFGHSSGSGISLVTKAGTNQWHGDVFYQGHYPWADALEDRVNHTQNLGRNHIFGATLSNPIIKNKLFNFFSWEQWRKTDPGSLSATLPTALERQGDFSQSLNACGTLRTIYDPATSVAPTSTTDCLNNATSITRTPFQGNVIPASRIDPVALAFMSALWQPNRPGIGPYHINNYVTALPVLYSYKNFTDRVDYNVSQKLRVFGRLGIARTPVTTSNPTGSSVYVSDRGSSRDATSYSGDIVYTFTANTVLDVHGDWHGFHDDATSPLSVSGSQGWGQWWPNSNWYAPLFANKQLPVFIPRMEIHTDPGTQLVRMGMGNGFWFQHPDGDSFAVKISHQWKSHFLKFGFDTLGNRAQSWVGESPGFGFFSDSTASTYTNPDIQTSGDGYASFLLGALEPNGWGWGGGQTVMPIIPLAMPATRSYAGFANDDWKVSRRLTLNLGLRYEFEQAFNDPAHHLGRPFDPTSPIPPMQTTPPVLPTAALSPYYTGPWNFTGAFNFTSASHPTEWNSGGNWSPRIGAAFRLNDKTALRAAYARYYAPWVKLIAGHNYLDVGYPGFNATSYAQPTVQGVPQTWLQNPFPASWPLVQSVGQTLGRYTQLGDSVTWVNGNRPHYGSDRINFSVERQLPEQFVINVTYFLNLTHGLENVRNINAMDPRLLYQNCTPAAVIANNNICPITQTYVANPFYNYLTPDVFPGPLRYQQQVTLGSLMVPYPQYGSLNEDQAPGGESKYQSLQIKLQRTFSKGYTVLVGYNYHIERDTVFYDDVAAYLRKWTTQATGDSRHRLSIAGVWDLPIGRGRRLFSGAPRVVDGIIGGWSFNNILSWRSGDFLQFGPMQASGNPVIGNPTPQHWFNTSVFQKMPALGYVERTNPWQYPGLTGPGMFNLDTSLTKDFAITERVKFQLQAQAFNTFNNMTFADPNTDINSGTFGMTTDILRNQDGGAPVQPGRILQLGMKVIF